MTAHDAQKTPALRYAAAPGGTECRFDPPLVLAPMAGITDRYFRRILRSVGGVGLVTMEFISSEGLHRGNKRTRLLMQFDPIERPLSIQIYGSRPEPMAEAARLVQELGADVCDINMGCPANKVLKGCAGAALMRDLDLAEAIISSVRKAITLPLTVKFRAGIREDDLNYIELGKICQDQGVAAVALHPRTAKQFYRGKADWDRIARLKDALRIPVIGNGDVATPQDAIEMMRRTGCDGVMIGRASMKNPCSAIFACCRKTKRSCTHCTRSAPSPGGTPMACREAATCAAASTSSAPPRSFSEPSRTSSHRDAQPEALSRLPSGQSGRDGQTYQVPDAVATVRFSASVMVPSANAR